jgi:aminopeptidase
MKDPRIRKLAQVLVHYSVKVQAGELAVVRGSSAAEPLMLEVGREILKAGGQPQLLLEPPDWETIFLQDASEDQLAFISPIVERVVEKCDCLIRLKAPTNTKSLNTISPSRQSLRAKAMRPIMDRYRERFSSGELRWVLTLFPTHALAQDAGMSLSEFEDFFYRATFVDLDDPVAAWQRVHDEQQRLVDWLAGKHEVHAVGPHVDLKFEIEGRPFRNSDGDRNMPSGEIFTSPIEDSVEGWYRGSYPAFYRGQEVHGLELRFEGGEVVEAKAERNQGFLLEMLDVDDGSRRLGEFAIGTNKGIQRFTRNILFDEKIGGTMHIALGSSYADVGGLNQSSIHWDIITDMRDGGQVFVDGELFYESGEFKV